MMDTVYGTKKYFQSLSGGSDIYRSSTCRAVNNDYSSYQNTLGRRSALAPYTHMNKHPSYSTDLSLGSQYAYSTWGMWRDPRNLSPSTYSTKSRHSVKSFSIILTTAAFIVLLAVISIAGLAFYFSTFKSNLEDPIMAFEGRFRISKGDLFTTGLKYNHTSTYKQKVDFYKRFVERSLSDNGLQTARIDITGFGDGPLLNVHFRALLDMRKLPQHIHSVEEHIRESLFLETTSLKSLYKSLRIEPDSMEVKRIIDEDLVKSATFAKDALPPTSQTHFEKRLTKKTGIVEKASPKISTTPRPKVKPIDDEPDVDVENAPVIQGSFEGSFEITKTDADITRKKTTPTKAVTTTTKSNVSQTTFSMKPKTKKTTIEKVTRATERTVVTTSIPAQTTMLSTKTTTAATTTTTTISSTPATLKEKGPSTSTSIEITTSTTPSPIFPSKSGDTAISTSTTKNVDENHSKYSHIQDPPKLDANLFTSSPILDTEPWRPIRPHIPSLLPTQSNPLVHENLNPLFNMNSKPEIDNVESGLLPRNKIKFSDQITEDPNKMIFYHSFTNPGFMPGTSGIERLGNADVKPHPLPVPLIDDVIIPAFKPLGTVSEAIQDFSVDIEADSKFEHIGGGVIVKKHDESSTKEENVDDEMEKIEETPVKTTQSTISTTTSTMQIDKSSLDENEESSPTEIDKIAEEEVVTTQLSDKIGELLYDLLDIPKEHNHTESLQLESRIEPEFDGRPNFLNIKEHILNRNKILNHSSTMDDVPTTSNEVQISSTAKPVSSTEEEILEATTKKVKSPGRPKPTLSSSDIARTTPVTLDDSMLFPSHSKWEYVNGSSNVLSSTQSSSMTKVFNETLQAWVVENVERPENYSLKDLKARKNYTENLQNISIIFDTLASKLGISPTMPTKVPPFVAYSQNKLKQSQKNITRNRVKVTTTVRPVTITRRGPNTISTTTRNPTTTTAKLKPTTTAAPDTPPTIRTTTTRTTTRMIPPITDQAENPNASPEVIIGEAEIEVVDPTKYEEMLSSQSVSTSTPNSPTLVTLLPVRSNSGIRTFRPPVKAVESRRFSHHPQYREAVVKTGIHVTA